MLKRMSSLALVMLIVVSLFAAQVSNAEEEVKDWGGVTVTLTNWGSGDPDFKNPDTRNGAWILEMEKKYNITINYEWVADAEYTQKVISSIVAGEPFGDAAMFMASDAKSLVGKKLLYPVDTIDGLLTHYLNSTPVSNSMLSNDGHTYGFMLNGPVFDSNHMFVVYNKSLAEREGLSNFSELYANGEWTWDAMLDASSKVHRDLDGDGIVDQFGITADNNRLGLFFFVSSGAVPFDGITVNYTDPAGLEAMAKFAESQQYITFAPDGSNWDWNLNKLADGDTLFSLTHYIWAISGRLDGMEDDYSFIPFPSKDGSKYYTFIDDVACWTMPVNGKNPEATAFVLELLAEPKPWDYEDGVLVNDVTDIEATVINSYEGLCRDEESLEFLLNMYTNNGIDLVMDTQRAFGIFWNNPGWSNFVNNVKSGEMTPDQAAQANQPGAQAIVDEILNPTAE